MKRLLIKGIIASMVFSCGFVLASCGDNSVTLPTTNYQKVKFAFDGVEKSFKKAAGVKSRLVNRKEKLNDAEGDALNTIYDLYTRDDIDDDFDDLEYYQPPMIQFQCLKKVFEKVGESYAFDTKYYDSVTGAVYVDMETGKRAEGDANKYDYVYTLALDLSINSNDLINADVSFEIKLSKGREEYNTKWYVNLLLDYDMNNKTPNYTLKMITENNELELPYYHHFTYEYDYVDVKDNAINEWRKFCYDANERMIKNESHPTFDSYLNNPDFVYKIDACSWYKNNVYYKNKNMDDSKKRTLGNALFAGLGLNATTINAEAFFNKSGTVNSAIKTTYSEFCTLFKDDVIYSLLVRTYDDHDEEGGAEETTYTGIRAMFEDDRTGADNITVDDDMTIAAFFANYDGHQINLWYVDSNNGLAKKVDDLSVLRFKVQIGYSSGNSYVSVGLTDHISDAYKAVSEETGINVNNMNSTCNLIFEDPNLNVQGQFRFDYYGSKTGEKEKDAFPQTLLELGVPEYKGENVKFTYNGNKDADDHLLIIEGTNEFEVKDYHNILLSQDFNELLYGQYEEHYDKVVSETLKIKIIVDKANIEKGTINLIVKKEHIDPVIIDESESGEESVPGEESTPWEDSQTGETSEAESEELVIESISLVGSFTNWELKPGIEFLQREKNYFFLDDFFVEENEKFKIVANHTWDICGGFGYKDISNIRKYQEYFEPMGDTSDIVVKVRCYFSMEAVVDENNNITFTIVQVNPAQY